MFSLIILTIVIKASNRTMVKRNIVILGARKDGHANVVLEIIKAQNKYNVVGFIDDLLFNKELELKNVPIIGTVEMLPSLIKFYNIRGFIVAIGNNKRRRLLTDLAKAMSIEPINAIHPSVCIDPDVAMGIGNYIGQGVIIVTGTIIGNCVNIHTGTTIDHNCSLQDGANLGPGVHAAGRVNIKQDVFIGTGTSIIPDITINEGSIIGAGSVIIGDVDQNCKVVGNPGKVIERNINNNKKS